MSFGQMLEKLLKRWRLWLIVLVVAAVVVWFVHPFGGKTRPGTYQTSAVDKGDIVQTVSANGTLNPVVLVNVGTQVSGRIKSIDVDYNDRVKAGQVLAEIDPSLIAPQLAQSRASLQSAEAALKLAEANAARSRALYAKGYIARADMDQAAEAQATAKAQVESAKAQVQRDQNNLDNTVIRSPVSGVVVDRDVDVGQTVAASFQTPTLFKIAQDLRVMQIDTSVAEADIGGVKVGQIVDFTVDAFADHQFEGKVKQVRLNPTIQSNVVTYDVVVAVDNPDERLLPGMTAYVNIVVASRKNVLRIPNAALRYRPATAIVRQRAARTEGTGMPPNGARPNAEHRRKKSANETTVYKLVNDQPVPVNIAAGITDNRYTEVVSGDLAVGDKLITEEASTKKAEGSSGFRIRFH